MLLYLINSLGLSINHWLSKARQKLGLLKRTCSFSKNLRHRKTLYLSIVRSLFEHCSVIWRPVSTNNIDKFEAIQKNAVKWICNQVYVRYSLQEYNNKLKSLDILPLNSKFDMNNLRLFHGIVYGESPIELPSFLVSRTDGMLNADLSGRFFQRHTRNAAAFDQLMFKCTLTPTVNSMGNMFFVPTYKLWNSLPIILREIKCKARFKIELKKHFRELI